MKVQLNLKVYLWHFAATKPSVAGMHWALGISERESGV